MGTERVDRPDRWYVQPTFQPASAKTFTQAEPIPPVPPTTRTVEAFRSKGSLRPDREDRVANLSADNFLGSEQQLRPRSI